MKKMLLGVLCVLLVVSVCACSAEPPVLETIVTPEEWEEAERILNEGLAAQGLDGIMEIDITVSGNSITYDYRYLDNEITKEEFDEQIGATMAESLVADVSALEASIAAANNTKGMGKVTVTTNIYNSKGDVLFSGTQETKEF